MIKRVLLLTAACLFAVLGVIGLVVPIIPGVLFLLVAAACVSLASDRVHQKMNHNPAYRRWRQRWDASAGLSTWNRIKLAFWLSVDTTFKSIHRS